MTANLAPATRAPLYNLAIGGFFSTAIESNEALPKQATAHEQWQATAPSVPGLYHFACEESDGEREALRVAFRSAFSAISGAFGFRPPFTGCPSFHSQRWSEPPDVLMVSCPHLGLTPLQTYHDGLTRPRWRLVSPSAHPMEDPKP